MVDRADGKRESQESVQSTYLDDDDDDDGGGGGGGTYLWMILYIP